jgi:hypothetical protein
MAQNRAYSIGQPLTNVFPSPIVTNINPSASKKAEVGQIWINTGTGNAWILAGITAAAGANWVQLVAGGGLIVGNLTVTGNLQVDGTSNFDGAVTTAAALTVGTDLTVTGNIDAQTDVTVVGTLGVTGVSTFDAAIVANNNVGVGGDLTVTGESTFNDNVTFAAAANVNINGTFNLDNGAHDVSILTDNTITIDSSDNNAGAISLTASSGGTAAKILLENDNGTSVDSIALNSPAGGILLRGAAGVTVTTALAGPTASPTANVAVVASVGQAVFTGFTTAAAASQVFTLDNGNILANSAALITVTNDGANDAQMTITRVKASTGHIEITVKNNGAAALNGNVYINYWITDLDPA